MENKVGVNGSAVTSTIDYKLANVISQLAGTTPTVVLSNPTLTNPVFQGLINGWVGANESWSYASGTTMTVPTGAALKYSVGDKVKVNQSIPLTAYFPLETKDPTVGSFTVTNRNAATFTAGKFSNALTLASASQQALEINDDALLKPTGAFTLGLWEYCGSSASARYLYQSNAGPTGFAVLINNGNHIQIGFGNATGASTLIGTTDICNSAFRHIVVSYQSNFCKVYVDGNLEVSGYMVTPSYAGTNYVRIGCSCSAGSNAEWFNGQIDDLFFINGFAVDQYWVAAKYAAATAQGTANITATYQGYVTAVTDALLTLTGGADYALYNGTITSPYYSKSSSPVGFPTEFSTATGYFYMNGRELIQHGSQAISCTSGQSLVSSSITFPVAYLNTTYSFLIIGGPSAAFNTNTEGPTVIYGIKAAGTCAFSFMTNSGTWGVTRSGIAEWMSIGKI